MGVHVADLHVLGEVGAHEVPRVGTIREAGENRLEHRLLCIAECDDPRDDRPHVVEELVVSMSGSRSMRRRGDR